MTGIAFAQAIDLRRAGRAAPIARQRFLNAAKVPCVARIAIAAAALWPSSASSC